MSEQTVYALTKDKPASWHSRRHQSRTPHDEAKVRYEAEHSKRGRQLRALAGLRERLARYISLALNTNGKPKRRSKKGSNYVPKDLQHATDLTREEIKILELKLGIKTKVEVIDDEGEDEV